MSLYRPETTDPHHPLDVPSIQSQVHFILQLKFDSILGEPREKRPDHGLPGRTPNMKSCWFVLMSPNQDLMRKWERKLQGGGRGGVCCEEGREER